MITNYSVQSRAAFEAACSKRASKTGAVATILGGVKCAVPTDDVGIVEHLLRDGFWESWVTLAAARHIKCGMRVLNIGANCGYYAALFASLGARVLAVEPQPHLVVLLRETARLNRWSEDQFSVGAYAIGATTGRSVLNVAGKMYGSGSFQSLASSGLDVSEVSVEVRTLDHVFGDAPPAYVFCDAEGWEPQIFQPAEAILKALRPTVTLEFSPARYSDPGDFAAWWLSLGYQALLVCYDGRERPFDFVAWARTRDSEFRTVTFVPSARFQ